jgi:hypothetical protein
MAITLRGVTTGNDPALATGTLTVGLPPGSQVGDSCYIFTSTQSGTAGAQVPNINGTPTPFSNLPSTDTGASGRLTGWYTTLTSTDITRGSFSFTRSAASGSLRIVASIIVTTPTNIDTSNLTEPSGNISTLGSGSATSAGNDLAVIVWGVATGTSPGDTTNLGTAPSGFTEYVNVNTANATQRNAVQAVDIGTVSSGTVGPFSRAATGTVQPRIYLLLLADASVSNTQITASDTVSASVTDTSSVAITFIAKSATDTPTASVTDSSSVNVPSATPIVASDTLTASVSDLKGGIKAGNTRVDTLSASVTDLNAGITVQGGGTNVVPMYDSPVNYNYQMTYDGGGTIQLSSTDTLTAVVSESISFAWIQVARSDTLVATLTENRSFGTIVGSTTDLLRALVVESSTVAVSMTTTDSLDVSVDEDSGLAPIAISKVDTLSANVTETRSFGTVTVSAADTLTATISESRVDNARFSAADVTAASMSESTLLLVNGNLLIGSSDPLAVSVTENTSFGTIPIAASDALTASVTDTRATYVPRSAVDTLSAAVTDISAPRVTRSAIDTLSAAVTETSSKVVSAKLNIYAWTGSAWTPVLPFVWTGSAWVEPEIFYWNGSVWV